MLSMTDYPTPKFPATPEEIKAASEKVMNFWVGALSPMWVPFWAASGFGLSAWAMTQNLSKNEGLLKDMPQMGDMAGKWPGFGGIWGAAANRTEATMQDTTEPMVDAAKSVMEAAPKAAEAAADKTVDILSDTAESAIGAAGDAVEKAASTVVKAVKSAPEPKVAFDPVIEAPVAISDAAVEAPAVLKAMAPKVEPKPIAKAVSAVKKPTKKT